MLKIDGVTHWSIPVNDLAESRALLRDVLGLTYRGRLGNSGMACVSVGGHDILLCERRDKVRRTPEQDNRLHHSFTLSPDEWEKGARFLHAHGVAVQELIYREGGFFPGHGCTSSTRPATCSRFATPPGSPACPNRPSRRSSGPGPGPC